MATVFINEIHYDNVSGDVNEGIEIAGPAGTDLTGWRLVLYNGSNSAFYDTDLLSGIIPNQQNGFGTLFFPYPPNGIQNGSPDAIALVDPNSTVVEFLSYEGTLTAVDGPAIGLTSTDIGVSEAGTEPVGQSLQLTGNGSESQDFTWTAPATNTYNAANNGQTFTGGVGAESLTLSISPATFSEAAGANAATGTITRTGSIANELTVDLISNDTTEATVPTTVTIAAGAASATFNITAVDDTVVDGAQPVILTALATGFSNGTGNVTVTHNDTSATITRIREIQGTAHRSPLDGQIVNSVPGIVTALRTNGFYLQDPTSDASDATSEGIFVFTSSAPTVTVGDSVSVSGTVSEFRAGGTGGLNNLSITQIGGNPTIAVLSSGNTLPIATIIGTGGRTQPTEIIDNDAVNRNVEDPATPFDPAQDGIDFYESLEGMRVQVNDAVAVGPTNDFGEIPVLADNGANATGRTVRGGIRVQPGDFNPERIIIDDAIIPSEPRVNVGDRFNDPTTPGIDSIIGVIDYSFGNFKLLNTEALPGTTGNLQREETALIGGANRLTVASFNVENLDPGDGVAKFSSLASLVVNNLKSPDIISLEEVQDNNGATNDAIVNADQTYNTLIAAIAAAGGPTYEFRQVNPVDDQDGGEPGGNIRVGFLFNSTKPGLSFVDRPGGSPTTDTTVVGTNDPILSDSPGRILDTDPTNGEAFASSRKPLAGEFEFNGNKVFVIGNHFNSKGGDDPLFGRFQPPTLSSEVQRRQQAQEVRDFVSEILTRDPNANVVVAGDLNDFEFSRPLEILENGAPGASDDLTNLVETLPANEQYTYVFEGNSQVLDQILVSNNLVTNGAEFDVVHVNSEFADQVSDHDPLVARFTFAPPAPPTLSINNVTIAEGDSGTTNATFTVSLSKSSAEPVTVEYATANDSATAGSDYTAQGNTLTFNPGSLTQTITVAVQGDRVTEPDETFFVNLSNPTNATIADGSGIGTITNDDTTNTVSGTATNETFTATPDTDDIDAAGGNDRVVTRFSDLQQNDTIAGGLGRDTFVLSVGAVSNTVTIDVANTVDQLQVDTALVTGFDNFDLSSFAGSANFIGGASGDNFRGGAGSDTVAGNNGDDILFGGGGNDTINGGAGNDSLDGNAGVDSLTGGLGNDTYFVDSTSDAVIEAANSGIDFVRPSASYTLSNFVENLTLTGGGAINGTGNTLNNTLIGNSNNNTLNGGAGIDTLLGGAGNDQLVSGSGADVLTGGAGADLFVFNFRNEGIDRITDFSVAVVGETINVSKAGFSPGLSGNAINQSITAQQFQTGSRAVDASDRFIYNRNTGGLFFDQDGTGATAQVQLAQLTTDLAMTSNDIFVIA